MDDDKEIGDETQIGYDPYYTKANMIASTSVDPIEFLANVIFGICSQQINTEGKHSIKELNANYIEALKKKSKPHYFHPSEASF